DRLTKTWYDNSPLKIIADKTADELKRVRYWIDCGDDDFLTTGNARLHVALSEKGVPHEYRVRDGAHNWTYWRTGITDALQFIGDSFHQKLYSFPELALIKSLKILNLFACSTKIKPL